MPMTKGKTENKITWSPDQKAVIESTGCELLVSAAAGSGKTAVLVERIYHRMLDEEHPVDIDRFVVVTFTNAAAAEMKDRLRERMEKGIDDETLSEKQRNHLRLQISRISSAHVSTVHSFCSYVIGQYFHRIGLDPSYRMLEKQEGALLKREVVGELLEKKYADASEEFLKLADLRTLSRSDTALEDWILDAYEKCVSEPFPDDTLKFWEESVDVPVAESEVLAELLRYEGAMAKGLLDSLALIAKKYPVAEDPKRDIKRAKTFDIYETLLSSIIDVCKEYAYGSTKAEDAYEQIRLMYKNQDSDGLLPMDPGKNDLPGDSDMIRAIKPLREQIAGEKQCFFFQSLEEHESDRRKMAEAAHALLHLVREFKDDFTKEKRDRGKLDYSDLEQYALEILYDQDPDTGRHIRSEAAIELADYFEEVMIDEYQDSNRVQDTLLRSICRMDESKEESDALVKNRFIVGDIKQSIYRFRGACPELFEEKMDRFSYDPAAAHRRIDLSLNFRSRPAVLDATNAVFEKMMKPDIGGVIYDEAARLNYGLNHDKPEEGLPVATRAEILCPFCSELTSSDMLTLDIQAGAIAERIEEMVHGDKPLYIQTKEGYRRVRYRDIVILSRGIRGIAGSYTETFNRKNIPFVTKLSEGFYDSREIRLMSQLLTVIDNPRQDIPLAGVLLSPVFGVTEEELAIAHAKYISTIEEGSKKTFDLVDILPVLSADRKDTSRPDPAVWLDDIRKAAPFVPLSELITRIWNTTGIRDWFASQKDGERRIDNLEYLWHLVLEFEKNGSGSVHEFLERLSRIEEHGEDIGEAITLGEEEDVVRLMTIHKSKGLEFPVVFVTRMDRDLDSKKTKAKGENRTGGIKSSRPRFVYHPKIGMGGRASDVEKGISRETIHSQLINRLGEIDGRGEDLRLLYVAMTRARDQLILVGSEPDKCRAEIEKACDLHGFFDRYSARRFMDMILPVVAEDSKNELFVIREIDAFPEGSLRRDHDKMADELTEGDDKTSESSDISENVFASKIRELLLETGRVDADSEPIPARISVSELKRARAVEEDEEVVTLWAPYEESVDSVPVPRFMNEENADRITGAMRGTIWHQVMAMLPFAFDDEVDIRSISQAIDELIVRERLKPEEKKVIRTQSIVAFFNSNLGKRMMAAEAEGRLYREQPFVIEKPAKDIWKDREWKKEKESGTPVMIQGIIDAYFEEGDRIVLMDYKTDRVDDLDGEQTLISRYRLQLELYREALVMLTGKPVDEMYLYSFVLGREIPVS